jgi:hypothetical protein
METEDIQNDKMQETEQKGFIPQEERMDSQLHYAGEEAYH